MNEEQKAAQPAAIPLAAPMDKSNLPKLSSIKELFVKSWAPYRQKFGQLMLLAIITPAYFMVGAVLLSALMVVFGPLLTYVWILLIVLGLPMLFFGLCLAIVCQAAMYVLVKEDRRFSFKELKAAGLKHFNDYFQTVAWAGVMIILWCLLLIVPGVVVAVLYSMAAWVYFYEGLSGRAALDRSKVMVKGYGWAVAGRLALVCVVPYIILSIIFPNDPVTHKMTDIGQFITNVATLLIQPFIIIYTKEIYNSIMKAKAGKAV